MPVINGRVTIDNTIASMMHCPRKAFLYDCLSLRDKQSKKWAMRVGQVLHNTYEEFFKSDGTMSPADIKAPLWDYYTKEFSEELPQWDAYTYENLEKITYVWAILHTTEKAFDFLPEYAEKGFNLRLTSEADFFGFIDNIVRLRAQPDWLYIHDSKTTSRLDNSFMDQWSYSTQLIGYTYASQQLWPDLDIRGALITATEVKKVPDSNRRCAAHMCPYSECGSQHVTIQRIGPFDYTPFAIKEWWGTLISHSAMLVQMHGMLERHGADRAFQMIDPKGKFVYQACKFCEFKDFCNSNLGFEHHEAFLEKAPQWGPKT